MSVLIFFVAVGVLFLLAAPFVERFAPEANIHIVSVNSDGSANILASGSEMFWFFWQNYLYIAIGMGLVLLIAFLVIFFLYDHYRAITDEEIKQEQGEWRRKNSKMEVLIEKKEAELNQINKTRVIEIKEKVERDIENKRAKINEEERKLQDREFIAKQRLNAAEAKLARSRDIICNAQEIREESEKEMRLKLKQADRLRAQKKSLIVFFEQRKMTYQNAPLTYQRLLELAKENTQSNH